MNPALLHPARKELSTRQQLEQWNKTFGGPDELVLSAFENHPAHGDIQNNMAKLSFGSKADEDLEGDEQMRDDEEEGDEIVTIGLFLSPGDVVELAQPGREPVLAVFVQQLGLTSQFYSVNGRWSHSSQGYISFAVPGAIDPVLLQPLIPYLPTKTEGVLPKHGIQVPRELGAPIQELLSQLTEQSERIYRTNAPVLDTAYSTLADATRTRMMTLAQIAKTLLGQSDPTWSPSPSALLAVRKALKHNEFRFRSDGQHQRLTNIFAIRPKVDVEMVETVHEWVREYREHEAALASTEKRKQQPPSTGARNIQQFVNKAQRLIEESRESRQSNFGFVGPDHSQREPSTQNSYGISTTVRGEEFSKADQQIISFLQAWVLMDQFSFMPNLHAACASILHATGCYNHVESQDKPFFAMGKSVGQMLLQEIGVTTPFENRSIYNENLMLPTVRLSRNLELLNTKAELTMRSPDFQDAMADMRRDWGSVTVYCIDAPDAKEIDDGISIERVYGQPSEYWLHVHVANPTAFFNKTHVLSGLAAHMTESVYTPERSWAMLPSWASQNYFSLANNRPVITFSARIDDSGNTLETKIQHGIIRKVVSITPDELAVYLDEYSPGEAKRLVVGGGGRPPIEKKSRPLPRLAPEQLENIRDLYAAARSLWKGRKAAGAVRLGSLDKADVAVYERPNVRGLTWMPPSIEKVRRVIGDPIIEVRGDKPRDIGYLVETINSSNIVEEMMLLACRTAGSWCAERSIPVMFRGTVESPSYLPLKQFREEILYPELKKNGSITYQTAQLYMGALGRSIAHSSPIPHHVIGATAYIKVTSPLRRFSDMIAHWQIEAALRFEARTGQRLNARVLAGSPRPILPFSHRQMQESIITLSPRERIIRRAHTHSNEFWAVQAFTRAFYYQEAPLPDTFIVRVKRPDPISGSKAFFEGYRTNCILANNPDEEYQFGDRWEAKISHIDTFKSRIHVVPIRLVWREEPI
jgi:hypothetical protein